MKRGGRHGENGKEKSEHYVLSIRKGYPFVKLNTREERLSILCDFSLTNALCAHVKKIVRSLCGPFLSLST